MNTDLATSLVMARTAQTHVSAQVAIARKAHEMDLALVQMLDQAVRPPPAPTGQGTRIDRQA